MRRASSLAASAAIATVLTLALAPWLSGTLSPALGGAGGPSPSEAGAGAAIAWWASGAPAGEGRGVAATWFLCLLVSAGVAASDGGPADGGQLGSAAVRSGRAAVRGSATWDGRRDPRGRGLVYGFSRGRYLFEPGRHVLIDGSTGSGKTRFCLIPTLDLLTFGGEGGGSAPHTVIVSDVKGELLELTGDELGRRGYRVLLLDAQRPMRGHRYNPLGLVLRYARLGLGQEAEQEADALAEALVPDEPGAGQSHWTESARGLLSALVLLVALSGECPDGARNLATVAEVLDRGTEGAGSEPEGALKALFRALPEGHPARARASQFLSSGGNELRSVLSTLKVRMRMFSSSGVAWLCSGDDIDPVRLLTEKTALFLHVVDEGSPYNALFSVLVGQVYSAARVVAGRRGGSLPRPVTIVGDEWGNLPRVPCLPGLLSLGRSYGLFWVGAVQNVAQLNRYGERDGRRKVLANCGVKVALRLGEEEDRAYFTELVGRTTRHPRSSTSSRGGGSTGYGERADDLIHAWEWTCMSPDRQGAVVVKQAENGVPASHAGAFRTPLRDCTGTPTRGHFDLGSREHERARREAYEARLEARAGTHRGDPVPTWCPEWPADEGSGGGWDGLPGDWGDEA